MLTVFIFIMFFMFLYLCIYSICEVYKISQYERYNYFHDKDDDDKI